MTVQGPVKKQRPDGMAHRGAKFPRVKLLVKMCCGAAPPPLFFEEIWVIVCPCTARVPPSHFFSKLHGSLT